MMYSIVGDDRKVRRYIVEMRKIKMSEKAEINKEIREKKKEKIHPEGLYKKLEKLERVIDRYSVQKFIPVQSESGIVVNSKLLEKFIKTLKGFQYQIAEEGNQLAVYYGKVYGTWTGELRLEDQSAYFEGFSEMPKLQIHNFLD